MYMYISLSIYIYICIHTYIYVYIQVPELPLAQTGPDGRGAGAALVQKKYLFSDPPSR